MLSSPLLDEFSTLIPLPPWSPLKNLFKSNPLNGFCKLAGAVQDSGLYSCVVPICKSNLKRMLPLNGFYKIFSLFILLSLVSFPQWKGGKADPQTIYMKKSYIKKER